MHSGWAPLSSTESWRGLLKSWCEAARGIKQAFGVDKAMGYLIGEKFLNFLQASDGHPEFAAELPRSVEQIKQIFDPGEIRAYLDGARRVGALGHP